MFNLAKIEKKIRIEFLKNSLFEGFLRVNNFNMQMDKEELKLKYINWLKRKDIHFEVKKTAYFYMCAKFDNPNNNTGFSYGKIFDSWYNDLPTNYALYL